jgi:hypothetical protein
MIKMPLTCMVRVDAYDQSSICTCTSSEDYLRCRVRVDPPCVGTRQQFRKEHERKPLYTVRKCCGWDTFFAFSVATDGDSRTSKMESWRGLENSKIDQCVTSRRSVCRCRSPSAQNEASQECTTENRHEIPDVHGHDC